MKKAGKVLLPLIKIILGCALFGLGFGIFLIPSDLNAGGLSGLDSMEITVEGNQDRILLIARYDNLGKGASGAAVECLNLVMGTDATTGLEF